MKGTPDRGLLAVLSVLAGLVDAMGFLALDRVFTAHVTGNLVVMAVQAATGGPPHIAQLLSVPVFGASAVVAYLLARRAGSRGRATLLAGQALLLLLVVWPAARHHEVVAASLAVAAMAFQNAFVRVSLRESATTSVMTGNLATLVIAATATIWPGPWTRDEAQRKLRATLPLVVGFFVGCAVGAVSVVHLGRWAFALPALVATLVLAADARRAAPSLAGLAEHR